MYTDNKIAKPKANFNPQSERAEKEAREYWDLFLKYKDSKNQNIYFLNKNGIERNIYDYVNDSIDRMNEYHLKPAHKEKWQNNVFDPMTRDKVIFILGQLATTRMKPEIIVNSESIFSTPGLEMRKTVYRDLLEAANRKNNDKQQLIWEMYTCLSEGTVIGYESWCRSRREVEYVIDVDPETGEKKSKKIKTDYWDDVFGEIIGIEEFFPENIWCNANEFYRKSRRLFLYKEMTKAKFNDTYGKFPNADNVKPAGYYINEHEFDWGISSDVNQDNVGVLTFFDAVGDEMRIWGNGTEIYKGCLPWNHKELPVWIGISEPIHQKFLFGKSFPDKLMGMQDVDNAILNGMLDQLYIALNSPIFVDGNIDNLDEGHLEPSRVYEMSPGSRIQSLPLGGISQSSLAILELIKKSMEQTSVSAQAQGVPTGGRKTKYEVQQLQEGALQIAGLVLQMLESGGMERKYWLRLHNILQYYSMPSRKKTGKKKFRFITIEDTKLSNGKIGKRMIQVVDNKEDIPAKNDLANLAGQLEGKSYNPIEAKVEPIVLSKDYLLNDEITLEIEIVPNSSIKKSEAQKINSDVAFYQMTAGDPGFDQQENKLSLAKAFNKPSSIVLKNQPQPQPQVPGEPAVAGVGANKIDLNML
jgi:hypothetical protein